MQIAPRTAGRDSGRPRVVTGNRARWWASTNVQHSPASAARATFAGSSGGTHSNDCRADFPSTARDQRVTCHQHVTPRRNRAAARELGSVDCELSGLNHSHPMPSRTSVERLLQRTRPELAMSES